VIFRFVVHFLLDSATLVMLENHGPIQDHQPAVVSRDIIYIKLIDHGDGQSFSISRSEIAGLQRAGVIE